MRIDPPYVVVRYSEFRKEWAATVVQCNGQVHKYLCSNADYNKLLTEAGNWARLFQAKIRLPKPKPISDFRKLGLARAN